MNLHILFCPAQSIAPDGRELPTAVLALTLDDETQYRCAGFVQAEIERYAEQLDENRSDGLESDEQDSEREQSGDEGEPRAIRNKKSKGKQSARHLPGSKPFYKLHHVKFYTQPCTEDSARSQLEKEYVFMGLVATFLRAIRAGAIHFRHCSVLLAHYGRLGTSFDLCAKLIVDILREEGMYQQNGEIVVAVITQALREVLWTPSSSAYVYTEYLCAVIPYGIRWDQLHRRTFGRPQQASLHCFRHQRCSTLRGQAPRQPVRS